MDARSWPRIGRGDVLSRSWTEQSELLEAEHESLVEGNVVTQEVYRSNIDVVVRMAEETCKDRAGQLRNAMRRQDFSDALLPIKRVRNPTTLLPFRETREDRNEQNWRFELHLRCPVEYATSSEAKTTIGTVEFKLTALPDFVDESLTVTE